MNILEQEEIKALEQLEESGKELRKARGDFYRLCSENEYVKGTEVKKAYERIEQHQKEFCRLDSELTELENAC